MPKIPQSFRLEKKIVDALDKLIEKNKESTSRADLVQMLIFREAIYKLDAKELHELFGEDVERLMLMYAVSVK